jgi:hypothetical protein
MQMLIELVYVRWNAFTGRYSRQAAERIHAPAVAASRK